LTIRIIGGTQSAPPITAETDSISLKGLTIAIKIQTPSIKGDVSSEENRDMTQYLFLSKKRLKLEITILPQGKSISAMGRVVWCDRNLQGDFYDVRAGIVIEEMEYEYKEAWVEFLEAIYQIQKSLGN
jgi:hypothetical protein